ncbi:MAG TPA: 3-hydroxyacyl-CoA dehydrogenase NAD-binding domain-containing protein [Beijerinckiaceae bacterium]|nr:3-hydroxyacyl-CoA dehydrogenase NAD-binding domain-containing protein [Beijerinckiaceae bacterium]
MVQVNPVTTLDLDGEIAVLTLNSPPVNALGQQVRAGLKAGIEQAVANPAVKAIVFICAGRTFSAGADITEFGKPMTEPFLPVVHATFENCPKPVVAAIHGTALGGGFETALVCHYRIAVPSAKFGLPEIKLGLIPGAGGTQRLPRLAGVEKAMDLIVSGAMFGARDALSMGVVDRLASEDGLLADAVAFAREIVSRGMAPVRVRDRDEKLAAARGKPEIFEAFRKANARKNRGFEAWHVAMTSIGNALTMPFDEALTEERRLFMELIKSPQSIAQRHVFFAEREVAKIPDVPTDTPAIPVQTVGIIGAGTMGGGIAMNFLNAGIPVTIVEAKQDALDRGVAIIRKNYEATAQKGRMTMADVEKRMALLTPTLDFAALAPSDLVIEAVFENMDIKKEIFRRLDATVKQGAILATNTSYLDVNEIAAATGRPEFVVGMHFFSPANVMRLLEVVRGDKTAKPVVQTAMQIGKKIGKIAVLVGVCHGFVGNRMLAQRQREAQKLILEGAMPWDVDRVLYAFGLPMGPFAMSDLAGLDIGWSKETSTSSTVREILCEMDRRGQKTRAGFYDYDENRTARPSPVVEKIILDLSAKQGIMRRAISDEEILQRCIYPMINEGAKILEEGKALRASDIDIVWINGYGWPVYRGGPMHYADSLGLKHVLSVMKGFEASHGADFKPSALLERLVAEGKSFARM